MTRGARTPVGTLAGVGLSALGAAGFAAKGVFAKSLYADGWGVEAVLCTRSFLALPIVAAWAVWAVGWRALLRPRPHVVLAAAAAGIFCYYVGALLDFRALTMIDASVERVLLFSYPSMVVVFYAVIYRERPEPRVIVALAITYLGILMVVTGLDTAVLRGNLAGAGLVLACAVTSAVYYLTGDRWIRSIGSLTFTLYALAAATACLAVHRLATHSGAQMTVTARDLALLAGLVLLSTVMPMLAMAEGVRRLGAPRAAIVSTVGPPTTILLGAWLLGERLRPAQWVGVALIVTGILTLEVAKRAAANAASAGDRV